MSRRAGAKSLYLVIAIGLALAPSGTDAADRLTGRARVIDGDTIEIAGTHIRLWGIDAPELNQICQAGPSAITRPSGGITNAGRPYRCGRDAAAAMLQLTRGRTIRCEPRDRDRYGRVVAVCRNEIVDLNAALVRLGWADDFTRYSHGHYRAEEEAARLARLGIWSGDFDMPQAWRREHRNGRIGESRRPMSRDSWLNPGDRSGSPCRKTALPSRRPNSPPRCA